jgi:hypothetical protein
MMAAKKEIGAGGSRARYRSSALTRRIERSNRLPPGRKPGRVLEGAPEEVVPELVKLLHEEARCSN